MRYLAYGLVPVNVRAHGASRTPSIIGFMPAVVALSAVVMSLLGLAAKGSYTSFLAIPVLFVVFFVGAVCEEVGWTGYAIDPLQARWGALPAATQRCWDWYGRCSISCPGSRSTA